MDIHERALWLEFQSTRSQRVRDRLLELYEPLARTIAARLYSVRVDDSVAFGDYLQYGRMGLMESVERYEQDREVPFAAYSSQRIRGSILNGIAKESELAAQRRFFRERWRARVDSLRSEFAPDVDRASLADVVTITMGLAVGAIVDGVEPVDHNPNHDPYAVNEIRQLGVAVRRLIEKLPDNERMVIKGHYVEHLEFQALGERLGVTKGRVSQIHARALIRLREALEGSKLDRKL
jgi:RNA polymerase sigma factor FliA